MADPNVTATRPLDQAQAENYGLHSDVLGPVEVLAQSVSAMAPSTSPSLTIPLVFALAGNATWLVYLIATGAMLLVGYCVSRFARLSASPGSLYSYTAETLPSICAVAVGWALLLAYLATGVSVVGGALYYLIELSRQFLHVSPPAIPCLAATCAIAGYIAYRDVKLSAEVMLWIEAISVGLIGIVLVALVIHSGFQIDRAQFHLQGIHPRSLGPALVLSIFSFVGFESATTLGAEARNPLRSIPRAVVQCVLFAGLFFMLCSYSEVLGFRGVSTALSDSTSPLHLLASRAGIAPLGIAIDVGAMVSMFACTLACCTAAARVALRMARDGVLFAPIARTSRRHGTPALAIGFSAGAMFIASSALILKSRSAFDIYDLAGSLAVFGFLTAYALVAVALPFAKKARGDRSNVAVLVSAITAVTILLIAGFDIQSTADPMHAPIPYVYLAYLAAGLLFFWLRSAYKSSRRKPSALAYEADES